MQTIKCVVVGDGAVGKYVSALIHVAQDNTDRQDLSFDLLYDQQVPVRVRPDGL